MMMRLRVLDNKNIVIVFLLLLSSTATAWLQSPSSPPRRSALTSTSTIYKRTILSSSLQEDSTDNTLSNNSDPQHTSISSIPISPPFDRRQFLLGSIATVSGLSAFRPPQEAQARGLVSFPVNDPSILLNSYHFLRVGDTLLEEEDIWSTNPMFLTNREAALSPNGVLQIQEACAQMANAGRDPGVVKFSLAASCIDSSNIVGDTMDLGKDRIVPEFTFLDPRGIGKWEMLSYSKTRPAVWALDVMEAGAQGTSGRTPANQDGTPNDTLADQAVRLRQVMSVLETLYSGETILLIFPDGTGPALLSAMIAGIPYNRVHEIEFEPGELRMDVTKASALSVLHGRTAGQKKEYEKVISTGREELTRLQSMTDEIVSLKDEKMEAERIAIDQETQAREDQRIAEKKREEEIRESRARQLETDRLNGGEKNHSNPLAAAASAGAVGVAGIFAASGGDKEEIASKMEESKSLEPNDKNAVDLRNNDDRDAGDLEVETEPQSKAASTATPPPPPPKSEDPVQAAEKAMEEYMDRDDGAGDWLSVMSSIIDDDDDDDDEPDTSDEAAPNTRS